MIEKKKKPSIRFKGFTDDWEQRKLGEISKLGSSKRVHREDYTETGIPFFRGSEISKLGTSSKLEDVLYISEEYYKGLKDKYGVPKAGDVLITAVGTLGNTYLIRDDTPFYFKDGNLIWLSNIEINSHYLNVYLGDGIGKKRVLESAAGSNQKALTMVKLGNVEVIFPSKEEQHKISIFFQKLDNLITLHQRKYDKLLNVKKAMLEKMFPKNDSNVPEIRFKGFTDDWEQRKLGEMSDSFEYGLNAAATEFDGENKYIRITDIDDESRKFLDMNLTSPNVDLSNADNYKLKKGDILFARTGASVGKSYIYKEYDGVVYYAGFLIRARIKPEYDAEFVFQNTLTNKYNKYIRITSQRSGQPGVNAQEYAEFNLRVPKYNEQSKIGMFFKQLDHLITLHQRELEKLKNIKKACLEKMFL